ncbi:hypothetical protein LOTGIDRAFT_229225 [Lottia gigantea]|uniref:G-protein coupled receptors family 1 profile domain-containing protein n=1 Tax=Lottia gigantea TaxID=225164 RepID=V4BLA3_LOTGI|nr:hypothetical protein LOTGIDRAFT_229225 [Lottia gigantea]ESO89379.1 hypothetical protein LOTGIDRAFT_229225 [Lottia gigantea]
MNNDYVTIALVMFFLLPALTANSLTLYCVLGDIKRQNTLAKELLLLLTCVDFIASVCIPLFHIIIPIIDSPSFFICMLTGLSQTFFSLFATGLGVLMACERFVALTIPYWYYKIMFQHKVRIPVLLMTLYIAAICILPPVGVGNVHRITVINGSEVITCGVFPKKPPNTTSEGIFPKMYAGSGCLFTLISVFLNILVIKLLYSMRHKISPPEIVRIEKEMNVRSRKLSQEFVLTKMVFMLSLSFLICLTPLYIVLLLEQTGIQIPKYLVESQRWTYIWKRCPYVRIFTSRI